MSKHGLRRLGGAALVTALASLSVMGISGAMAAHKSKIATKTYTTGNINANIPDSDINPDNVEHTVRAPLSVGGIPNNAKITDVNVGVRISDTAGIGAMRDLDIHLATPRGVIRLSTDNGGTSNDFGSGADSCAGSLLVFDSQATNPITGQNPLSDAPVSGSFAPEEPLQAVNGLKGLKAKQPWTLTVTDDDPQAAHTLHCVNLVVQFKKPKKK